MTAAPLVPARPALGFDVGGTKVRGIAWDGDQVLSETVAPTVAGRQGVVALLVRQARELAANLQLDGSGFASLGVGIPGLVDPARGVVHRAVNLDLVGWDMAADLRRAFDCPVRIDNDLKVTVLGAVAVLGRPLTDVVHLNLGTGLSVGVVSGGAVLRGRRNSAGEFGHIAVFEDGELCACGQRGCLESAASGAAYLRARLAGDTRALARFFTGVDLAIRAAVAAYDPEQILVGGGLVEHNPELFEEFVATQRARAESSELLREWDIASRLVLLPSDRPVAAIGAAKLGSDAG